MALPAALFTLLTASHALDNGLAARPGLGWNSDYCTSCVSSSSSSADSSSYPLRGFENEAFIKHIAQYINSSGLQALGYTNVNMDSLWDLPDRDANGDLQPDPSLWPSGFSYIVDFVHSYGLGFGVYGDRGTLDCNKCPGQLGHEEQDAAFFAKNGIDWFKSDSCYASPDPETAFAEYGAMRDALNKTGRRIWFALCGWNSFYAWQPPGGGGTTLGNSWRVNVDTGGGWGPIMSNMDAMLHGGPNKTSLAPYARPGGWSDMCLLLNPGMGNGPNLMSKDRHRSQFGLHCIFNANMLLTGNLSALDPYVLATWGNVEAVAINQDVANTFIQLPLDSTPPLRFTPASVAECGGEPAGQTWKFNVPATDYLNNAANNVCLNVANCETEVIYDGCTTGKTCNPPGEYYNQQWTLDARGALVSALPGGPCATVDPDGTVTLTACASPPSSAQVWRYTNSSGQLVLVADGRCLTVNAPPPPSWESVAVGRELEDGSWALFGLNNANSSAPLVCGQPCLDAMGLYGKTLKIRDVWAHQDLPQVSGATELQLPAPPNGGSAFWRLISA